MKSRSYRLTKSKYTQGLQCLKALYLEVHHRELKSPIDASQQRRFNEGHRVGLEACRRYPGGTLISENHFQLPEAAEATKAALAKNPPAIFEATFFYQRTAVRVDILRNNHDGTWDIIEVKSTASVKDVHYPDMAVQLYIAEKSGLKIKRVLLKHINTECVSPDLTSLFIDVDCTQKVREESEKVAPLLASMYATLEKNEVPKIDIHENCSDPYECGFKAHCWKKIPAHSVFEIKNMTIDRKFAYYRKGTVNISDISDFEKISEPQARQIEAVKQNSPVLKSKELKQFLSGLKFPLYFLDFETIATAIPLYEGTRPYQSIPFQFSLHILEKAGAPLKHTEWLADSAADPRSELAKVLCESIGPTGTILAYHAQFEVKQIKDLAAHVPAYQKRLLALTERFVDLKDCFTKYYYHPEFHGSASLKKVLPVLVPKMSYQDLSVSDGDQAQATFEKLLRPETSPIEKTQIRSALLKYCAQDTEAMVRLWEVLCTL